MFGFIINFGTQVHNEVNHGDSLIYVIFYLYYVIVKKLTDNYSPAWPDPERAIVLGLASLFSENFCHPDTYVSHFT